MLVDFHPVVLEIRVQAPVIRAAAGFADGLTQCAWNGHGRRLSDGLDGDLRE